MFKCCRKFAFSERKISYVRDDFRKNGFTAYNEGGGYYIHGGRLSMRGTEDPDDLIDCYRGQHGTCSQGISQFYLHTHTFIRNRNELYLPLPSQPQLVLIYRPRRNGRPTQYVVSRPRCEVAPAEIRTCNLPTTNPAVYKTATSAPSCMCVQFKL